MTNPTGPAVRYDREVQVQAHVASHSEVVIRGGDICQILDRLAVWVHDHHRDIRCC